MASYPFNFVPTALFRLFLQTFRTLIILSALRRLLRLALHCQVTLLAPLSDRAVQVGAFAAHGELFILGVLPQTQALLCCV